MHKFIRVLSLSLLFGILSLWLLVPRAFSRDTAVALTSLTPGWLFVGLGLIICWWLTAGYRTVLLSEASGSSLRFRDGVQSHVMGVFSSAITPAGGGSSIGIAWILTRFGVPLENAVNVSVMSMVSDLVFFGWAVPLSFIFLVSGGVAPPFAYLNIAVALLSAAALIGSYLLVFRLHYATAILRRLATLPYLSRFKGRGESLFTDLEASSKRLATKTWTFHLSIHALATLARLFYFLFLNCVMLALGIEFSQLATLAYQVLIHTFAFIIPSPGASGYQEAALSLILRGEIKEALLSATVILWRSGNNYLYFLFGPFIGGFALLRSLETGNKETVS